MGRDRDGVLRFEEIAGLVESASSARRPTAPSPSPRRSRCRSAPEMPVELLAGCVGLDAERRRHHGAPAGHRLGRQFLRRSPRSRPHALTRAAPDIGALQGGAQKPSRDGAAPPAALPLRP